MKLLLDTQIALWAWISPERIPKYVCDALLDRGNEVWFSQVSTWEIQIKYGLNRLPMPDRPEKFLPAAIQKAGFLYAPIEDGAIFFLDRLPNFHRDPYDRLLIAQAIYSHYHLVTVDSQVTQYPVLTI